MIPQLEEQLQMSFNLFSFFDNEGHGRYVMFVSKRNMPREIDLLYYDNHYVWIKNFSRLFHDITKVRTSIPILQALPFSLSS